MNNLDDADFKNVGNFSPPETISQAASPPCPLLTESEDRFVMFPIKDQRVWQMYKITI